MLSSVRRLGVQKKLFSTLTPREQILSSLSKLELISKAKTDAELDAALKASTFDAQSLSEDVKAYVGRTVSSTTAAFAKDPKAWHNKEFGDYVVEEVTRKEASPFFIGGA